MHLYDRDLVLPAAGRKFESVLPALLEKSLERGWKVVVQGSTEERIEALDAHLWTYRDDGFLPHGTWRKSEAAQQPVLLTPNDGNPNGATVRFLVDRAPLPVDVERYQRIVLVFDGEDDEAVAAARAQWSDVRAKGLRQPTGRRTNKGAGRKRAEGREQPRVSGAGLVGQCTIGQWPTVR